MTCKLFSILILSCTTLGFVVSDTMIPKETALFEPVQETSKSEQDQSANVSNAQAKKTNAIYRSVETASGTNPLATGQLTRTTLGVHVGPVSDALRKHLSIPKGTGLLVEHVVEGSGAAKSSLKRFDVLYKFDDQILVNSEQLSVLVEMQKPGSKVELTIIRDGKSMEIDTVLQARKLRGQLGKFDAFHFFHGHAGRTEFQNCSVCHQSSVNRDDANGSPHDYDNYKFFHGKEGAEAFQQCSNCHAQVIYPLNISKSK